MIHKTLSYKVTQAVLVVILGLTALLMIVPILHVVAYSFSDEAAAVQSKFVLFPTSFTLNAYSYIFSTPTFFQSIRVSLFVTVVGTVLKMLVTFMLAYMLAHKDLPGRKLFNYAIVFTLVFSVGLVPNFLTIVGYGLRNTLASLIVPGLIDSFNLIIIRTFIQNIPMELEESAKIDGCNEVRILFSIIMPLSMASIATFSLFYAVGLWNSYMNAVLYIDDATKYPIQVLLRQIILMSSSIGDSTAFDDVFYVPPKTVRMAVITASTLPILLVYPFVQKHFTKGVMLGSVKG